MFLGHKPSNPTWCISGWWFTMLEQHRWWPTNYNLQPFCLFCMKRVWVNMSFAQILSMEIHMWKKGLGIFPFSLKISICNTHANSQDNFSSKLTSRNTIWLQNTKNPNCTHMVAWRFRTIFDNGPRSKIPSTNLKQIEPLNWTFLHINSFLWSTMSVPKGIGLNW
jgi:hypothetical protein